MSSRDFDRTLTTLSSGALAISLVFVHDVAPHPKYVGWLPDFVDYLYVSFTNALAFSPTDVMPMTRWAKLTMLGQSVISVITVALVIARAVNILR